MQGLSLVAFGLRTRSLGIGGRRGAVCSFGTPFGGGIVRATPDAERDGESNCRVEVRRETMAQIYCTIKMRSQNRYRSTGHAITCHLGVVAPETFVYDDLQTSR
ncbi:hypothetical protein MRB53_037303 [Persea americana]|nr:hypothetical protein MRB53_037303 [Persea americana]